MQAISRCLLAFAAGILLTTLTVGIAQQTLPDAAGGPAMSTDPATSTHSPGANPLNTAVYRDLDLLRRNSFLEADQASLLVRVHDPSGDLLLNTAGIRPGAHILEVEMHGPGMRGNVRTSRSLAIAPRRKRTLGCDS